VLRAIADGAGPHRSLLALGYAGWGSGQLDSEIRENSWLNVPADPELLFGGDLEHKYEQAIHKLGIDVGLLSSDAGHA
jgi:putative transcriptional regulator